MAKAKAEQPMLGIQKSVAEELQILLDRVEDGFCGQGDDFESEELRNDLDEIGAGAE